MVSGEAGATLVPVAMIDEEGDGVAFLAVGDATAAGVDVGGVTGEHPASAMPRSKKATDVLMGMPTWRPLMS
jgi:hypothetical protein